MVKKKTLLAKFVVVSYIEIKSIVVLQYNCSTIYEYTSYDRIYEIVSCVSEREEKKTFCVRYGILLFEFNFVWSAFYGYGGRIRFSVLRCFSRYNIIQGNRHFSVVWRLPDIFKRFIKRILFLLSPSPGKLPTNFRSS